MTADTYSNTLGYLIMGTGNDNNSWGGNANTSVFQIFEDAIANALTSAVTGGTLDLSGSPPPAAASQTRYAALAFTGTLASNQIVQVPNLTKFWWVNNATAGAYSLKFKTPSGSASSAIPQNAGWQLVLCDGANGIVVFPFNTVATTMPDGSASAPSYSFANATNSGFYRWGTQDLRVTIAGSDVLQITGTGAATPSVINVLSPNALQVNGVAVLTTASSGLVPVGTELYYAGHTEPTNYLFEFGQAISRSTYATLFAAITKTCTASTNTSTTLTSVSVDLTNLGFIGAYIEGTGIPANTTITAIAATTITLSQAATATATGVSIRILPWGQGNASTTYNLPDRRGRVLAARDDMGGTAASRLTAITGSLNGVNLNATGGAQSVTLDQTMIPSHVHYVDLTSQTESTYHQHATYDNTGISQQLWKNAGDYTGSSAYATGSTNSGNQNVLHTHPVYGNSNATGGGAAHANVQPTGVSNMIIRYA